MNKPRKRADLFTRAAAEVLETDLGAGVCGRIRAAILTYGVVDSFGTSWKPGCMDRTRAKVAAGKVDFFVANDDAYHQYGTKTHIGIVRSIETVGDQELATIDLFDTPEGRAYKEYVKAVMAAGGNTGYSVGVYDRSPEPTFVKSPSGKDVYVFTEVELDELSGTARPAVPGTRPLAVRSDSQPKAVLWSAFDALLLALPKDEVCARVQALGASPGDAMATEEGHAAPAAPLTPDAEDSRSDTETPAESVVEEPEYATMEQRYAALRQSYAKV